MIDYFNHSITLNSFTPLKLDSLRYIACAFLNMLERHNVDSAGIVQTLWQAQKEYCQQHLMSDGTARRGEPVQLYFDAVDFELRIRCASLMSQQYVQITTFDHSLAKAFAETLRLEDTTDASGLGLENSDLLTHISLCRYEEEHGIMLTSPLYLPIQITEIAANMPPVLQMWRYCWPSVEEEMTMVDNIKLEMLTVAAGRVHME